MAEQVNEAMHIMRCIDEKTTELARAAAIKRLNEELSAIIREELGYRKQWLDLCKEHEASTHAYEKARLEIDIRNIRNQLRLLLVAQRNKQGILNKTREQYDPEYSKLNESQEGRK
ncbi:MAG: hypothetical protein MMC33_003311 [Icmadophila ericetorum]|nr:hypothetical protein [Icmadophila ericetorum]